MSEITYLQAIADALREEMTADERVFLIGQDIGVFGGAFKVTEGLQEEFGSLRVIDAPLSETAIVGGATGAALMGLRPVAEMQFADFVSCGWDQLVTVAAKQHWRAGTPVPITLRLPSGGGFSGGPFHSQNPESSFAHVPGLKCVCPATPDDAKGLLIAAIRDPNPVLFFEHKHLYRRIRGVVRPGRVTTPIGEARIHRHGDDVTLVTWGAMLFVAEEAAARLDDVSVELIDLRSILPWDRDCVLSSVRKTSKVLILHEDTRTGGFGAEIAATIAEEAFEYLDAPPRRLTAPDSPVPFASVLETAFIPQVADVAAALRERCVLMATGTVIDVVMPQMGVSVTEGTVTRWLRNVGDRVAVDDTLLEISTDKVDTDVPCATAGVLCEILVSEGQTVAIGTVLARIDVAAASSAPPPAPPSFPSSAPFDQREAPGTPAPDDPAADDEQAADSSAHVFISPVVARIAVEHQIDLTAVSGSGSGGRITKKDVLAHLEQPSQTQAASPQPVVDDEDDDAFEVDAPDELEPDTSEELSPPPAAVGTPTPAAEQPAPPPLPPLEPVLDTSGTARLEPGEQLEPLSAMRRGIAEHMRRSLDTAAHVTSVLEVDMTRIVGLREQIKDDYESAYGVRPTYLSFVARAAVETLRDWPWLNAQLRPDGILTRTFVNLGVAVSLEGAKGLIVPVIKHAEGLNLVGMARGIADLAERARSRRLLPDDVQGGTFTITSPGGYGTLLGTPVISQPQSAILGVYAITRRPWVITGASEQESIAIRSIMNLTLTYDHRLIDGAYAAQFLRELGLRLERWEISDY